MSPVLRSASTWRAATPAGCSAERRAVLDAVADLVGAGLVRVGIDGRTAAGKTTLADELAEVLAERGRTVLRATLDDLKHPWRDRHLHDRESGEGYYRNAFDLEAIRRLFERTEHLVLCTIDPKTQLDHSAEVTPCSPEAVLVVDGVFAFRPELVDGWDVKVWVDVDPEVALARGLVRDADVPAAASLHADRYAAAEAVYLAEVDAPALADAIVDNTDPQRPHLRLR